VPENAGGAALSRSRISPDFRRAGSQRWQPESESPAHSFIIKQRATETGKEKRRESKPENMYNNGARGFSIHDAFEEETDEAIRVYGSTVISTPMRGKQGRSTEDVSIRIQDPK